MVVHSLSSALCVCVWRLGPNEACVKMNPSPPHRWPMECGGVKATRGFSVELGIMGESLGLNVLSQLPSMRKAETEQLSD